VQLRFACEHTGEGYVSQEAWRDASLPRCPLHPQGGCGFARHGTYERVSPPGTLIARWYCPTGHRTFSLLPDCLAARLSGTLGEVEEVVREAEQAAGLEVACQGLRLDIELPGALRWIRRRVRAVHASLHLLKGLFPGLFATLPTTLTAFSEHVGVGAVLGALRQIAAAVLQRLPAPLGFAPRPQAGDGRDHARQHRVGADPPGAVA
jgi:hypothetical protein